MKDTQQYTSHCKKNDQLTKKISNTHRFTTKKIGNLKVKIADIWISIIFSQKINENIWGNEILSVISGILVYFLPKRFQGDCGGDHK